MVIYVLDASAVLRFLDEEAGVDRMTSIFEAVAMKEAIIVMSSIQWGEIAGVLCKRNLQANIPLTLARLSSIGVEVIAPSANQAVRAAILQCNSKLPYADAFVVTLAEQFDQATILTADFDLLLADSLVPIELLPRKPS